jgi:hypothetical protein
MDGWHGTGQYCKKIHGKMYYFGSDKKEALDAGTEHSLIILRSL